MNWNKSYHWIFLLVILIVASLIYSNSFKAAFQFDDGVHIVQHQNIQSFDRFSDIDYWLNINERPLAVFSLALNYSIHELDLFGYHLFNLLIHFLGGVFVFYLSLQIIKKQGFENGPLKNNESLAALFVALVFISHPLQTQAVTYVVQRMTSMAALFYLGSLYFYVRARFEEKLREQLLFYFLTFVFAIAALMSKQIAISIPLAILLVEIFFVRNKEGKIYKNYLIVLSSTSISFVLAIIVFGYLPKETELISRSDYLITQLSVLVKYMQLLIFPISQNLDYDFPISSSLFGVWELINLFVNVAIIYLAIRMFKKYRLISFGIFWFYISLLVESSVIPIKDVIFEHRLYLPMFGFAVIIVVLAFNYLGIKKLKYLSLILGLLILTYGFNTFERNKVWESHISLWKDVTVKSPQKARGFLNLGIAYFNAEHQQAAIHAFDRCIELDPHNWQAYFNKASVYTYLNKHKDAIKTLNDCIALNKNFPDAYDARGLAKVQLGDYNDAISDFDMALIHNPGLESAWFNRANARVLLKDFDLALLDFNQAILLNPDFAVAFNNRGQLKILMGEFESAIDDLDKAIALDETFVNAYNNRAKAFASLNNNRSAVDNYTISMHFDKHNPLVFRNRALCFFQLKMYDESLKDFKTAVELGDEESKKYLVRIDSLLSR